MTSADYQFVLGAYRIILRFPRQFRDGFDNWLWDNVAIQRAFEKEALAVVAAGRTHYSPYTIIEYIRHWTLLSDANSGFKIDQNWGSSMARLFVHKHPQHADLRMVMNYAKHSPGYLASFADNTRKK